MEAHEFITHIRQKTVCDVNNKRSFNRSYALNMKRNNFAEIEKKLQAPSISEFKELCKVYSQKKKDRDLYKIRLGLTLGPIHITEFHNTDGALYALVSSLTGGTPKLQMEALYCLINLGLGSETQCCRICDKVGIYLISLGSNNEILQEYCLWIFGNLCGNNPRVCQIAQKQGLEEAIVISLSSPVLAINQSASYVLGQYLNAVQHRLRTFCTKNVIQSMIHLAKRESSVISSICWSLFSVSTQKVLCPALIDSDIVSFALNILNSSLLIEESETISTSLVRILTNCVASINKTAIELLQQVDTLVPVCCRLLNSAQAYLIGETIQLIANICNAATKLSVAGDKNILEDSNFKKRVEPQLKIALASHFDPSLKPVEDFNMD